MTDKIASPVPRVRLFRLLVPVVVGLVGLIFAIVGIVEAASQTWERASGTAQSCQTRLVRTGNGTTSHPDTSCVVSWRDAAGRDHTGTLDVGGSRVATGQTVELRVSGDTAIEAVPGWFAYGSMALGAVLLAGAVTAYLRSRPRARG